MTRMIVRRLAVACVLMLTASTGLAHHGLTAKFDREDRVSLEGRVTHVDWANPHVHFYMVVERDGEYQRWFVELESPVILEANGWSEDTVEPGEAVSVTGFGAWDGSRQVWGDAVTATGSGQRIFTVNDPDVVPEDEPEPRPTPRWPDGTPRLSAPDNEYGYWAPTETVLMEDGVDVEMESNGQLLDMEDAERVAPLQDWALALYRFRQRNHLSFDPTFLECRPPAGPRKFLNPFGIQLLEDRPLERIFVVAAGGNQDWHIIYTDGRSQEDFEVDRDNVLYYGRAVGEWEGDTFVAESEGFNEKFWLRGGLPHTDLMQTTERITRTDFHTLNYEVTIDDPGAYTRPWTSSWTLKWVSGEPPEYYCQDNRL